MNKLTSEQRDWLIGIFREKYIYHGIHVNDPTMHDVEAILNQCTEQEFPAYRYHATYSHAEYEVTFESPETDDTRIVMHATRISNERETADIRFDVNDFKEFTIGCQKIVEWLDNANR